MFNIIVSLLLQLFWLAPALYPRGLPSLTHFCRVLVLSAAEWNRSPSPLAPVCVHSLLLWADGLPVYLQKHLRLLASRYVCVCLCLCADCWQTGCPAISSQLHARVLCLHIWTAGRTHDRLTPVNRWLSNQAPMFTPRNCLSSYFFFCVYLYACFSNYFAQINGPYCVYCVNVPKC